MTVDKNKVKNKGGAEISLSYDDGKGYVATKVLNLELIKYKDAKDKNRDLRIVNDVFSSLYSLLAIEANIETSVIDSFLEQAVEEDKNSIDLDIEPTFKNIDDFATLFNNDEGFKNFMFDFYKKTFCEGD